MLNHIFNLLHTFQELQSEKYINFLMNCFFMSSRMKTLTNVFNILVNVCTYNTNHNQQVTW